MSEKKNLGAENVLYPSLTVIVGAVSGGRPNFMAVAHVGIMNHDTPQYISVGINKGHFTTPGIHEHREFSVNIPGEDLLVKTDYVGLVSGRNTDKSGLFTLYRGQLEHAPLIAECPVSMECRLHRVVDFPKHDVFIGEIVATHADPAVLGDTGKVDIAKVRPLLFDFSSVAYWSLGSRLAGAWDAGKALKRAGREG